MSTVEFSKRLIFKWSTLKGLAAIILFLIAAILIEYLVVLYAINLGVKDETLLQWSFQLPGADWIITIAISPLFHLVPIAVIITLVSSWTYLTRYVATKRSEKRKGKVKPVAKRRKERGFKEVEKLESRIRGFFGRIKTGLLRIRGVSYLWQKIDFARATIKSALTVLLVFGTLILFVSLLAYPQLIYRTVSNAYQNNPSLLDSAKSIGNFGKDIAEALGPIDWIRSSVNNALRSLAPGLRNFILTLGVSIKPLVELNDVGKYVVFQNVATWISAVTALFYGEYRRKSYRYKKRRR